MQAAADMGLEVVERPVPWDEVGSFEEVAACGTAVVLTPIQSITRGTETVRFGSFDTISKLYDAVTSIQVGAAPDWDGRRRGHLPTLLRTQLRCGRRREPCPARADHAVETAE